MQSVIFEFQTERGIFRDALHFDDGFTPSDAEIEAMKQERLSNWLYALDNPISPNPIDLTIEHIPEGTPPEVVATIKNLIEG